jgi:hypothetical protein
LSTDYGTDAEATEKTSQNQTNELSIQGIGMQCHSWLLLYSALCFCLLIFLLNPLPSLSTNALQDNSTLSEKKGDADVTTFEDDVIDGSHSTDINQREEATENTSQNQTNELSIQGMGM